MTKEIVRNYWGRFLASLLPDSPYRTKMYITEGWGDGPAMADELGALIARGIKTATCSSLWEWEVEGSPIAEPGLITIFDGRGKYPKQEVQTT